MGVVAKNKADGNPSHKALRNAKSWFGLFNELSEQRKNQGNAPWHMPHMPVT
jgi:hypothetical protein